MNQAIPVQASWKSSIARYQQSSTLSAVWQLLNSVIPYLLLWYVLYLTRGESLWLNIPLCCFAAAFLVRIFIIFHDCGHGSFLRSRRRLR